MSNIEKIDKNFEVVKTFEKEGFTYYNILEKPFKIYGVIREDDRFVRMPGEVAKTVSDGVYALSTNNAGGRVRFKTDSKKHQTKHSPRGYDSYFQCMRHYYAC